MTKPYIGKHGYWLFKEITVHREIASRTHGRPLRSNEHVHHIDGNQANNEIHNLHVCSASEHTYIHKNPLPQELIATGAMGPWRPNVEAMLR
jgi:hypothetical protein